MPPLRPLSRCVHVPQPCPSTSRASRTSSQSLTPSIRARALASSHTPEDSHPANLHETHASHESQYDPPSGWLWGVPPGEKYKKEGWENTWVYGYWGSLILGVVLYAYKPDTSIQTWALEEARRRLEKEGILEDPFPENGKKPRPRRYYEARDE